MAVWIFQANPDIFDIESYLRENPENSTWQVNQYRNEIDVGDRVYLWKSQGQVRGSAGIVAEAVVTAAVADREEDPRSKKYYKDASEAASVRPRVLLDILRIGTKKQILKRDWLLKDPTLNNLSILKQAAGTNFPVAPELQARLAAMWAVTGEDWTEKESLAGLWAYVETQGKPISESANSPVGRVSTLTARAIPGVYNKVMNFRSLDPTDPRKGMDGVAGADREVWSRYFDAASNHLDAERIRADFEAAWGSDGTPDVDTEGEGRDETERRANRLAGRDLGDLLAAYQRRGRAGPASPPRSRTTTTTAYERDPLVIAIAKRRANFSCEVPGCEVPAFLDNSGVRYCEVHHIDQLGTGGPDIIENAACLCAQHHREVHFGTRAQELKDMLKGLRAASEGGLAER